MMSPVKTEGDYDAALERIEALWGAVPDTPEGNELDVLLTLVQVYEDEHHPVPPPTPIEAIKFVMDQRGLKQSDLVRYVGSKSKVSEVLNGKRALTLSMIRALHVGLDIPAEILIQEGSAFPADAGDIDWKKFPVTEVVRHGWISGYDPKSQQEEIVRELAFQAGINALAIQPACRRQGNRCNLKSDSYATHLWILKIRAEARKQSVNNEFIQQEVNNDFLRKTARLSLFSDGPLKAQEYLQERGIKLVFAHHLKQTYIDGVVCFENGKTPVIGMSLRFDRIDNFWFTLLHELSHLSLHHLRNADDCIIDDLELDSPLSPEEREADKTAQSALIPEELWMNSPARSTAKLKDVRTLAREADVHVAVVAGRIRREKGNYRLLAPHVGHGEVRKLFY